MNDNVNYLYFLEYVKKNFDYKKIKVLDFGCGRGEMVDLLLQNGIDAVGVDVYSDEYHGKCSNEELLKDSKIFTVEINKKFPFKDSYFDLIISNQVFEHVENIEFTISELSRILKENGVIYHHIPTKNTWREGHIKIPFSHWFKKGSKIRYYYVYLMRLVGFGRFKDNYNSIKEFTVESLKRIDEVCFYRTEKYIKKYFKDYKIKNKEIDYIAFRSNNFLLNKIIKLKILNNFLSWLFRRLAFSAIELKRFSPRNN